MRALARDVAGIRAAGQGGAGQVCVRRTAPADREALSQMFERCTVQTRHRRFHGPVKAIPERYLAEALSGSPVHYALVACPEPAAATDSVVALGSCRTIGEGAAELGILVEDAWQRHGIGDGLLHHLVTHAGREGLRVLQAQILVEQAWIAGLLRRYGSCDTRGLGSGALAVTLRLNRELTPISDNSNKRVALA